MTSPATKPTVEIPAGPPPTELVVEDLSVGDGPEATHVDPQLTALDLQPAVVGRPGAHGQPVHGGVRPHLGPGHVCADVVPRPLEMAITWRPRCAAIPSRCTEIAPIANTTLSGLYLSSGNYFTQCEKQHVKK